MRTIIPWESSHGSEGSNAPGSPPGFIRATTGAHPSTLSVFAYDESEYIEEHGIDVARVAELRESGRTLWVDLSGLADVDLLQQLGQLFELHPLVLEDVIHVAQRPKVEEYEKYNFIVIRTLTREEDQERDEGDESLGFDTEQLAIVYTPGAVITFQERPYESIEPVRERIRRGMGRIRYSGADYLTYAVIDAVVDHYAPLLERIGEYVDDVEQRIVEAPEPRVLVDAYALKQDLITLRRVLMPMRDAISRLHNEEVPLFSPEVAPYLRDCHDHATRLIENMDLIRESAAGLMDLYISCVSHRMNEVMKVLTIIATIFIPLSFIAGVYGMNFSPDVSPYNMPELSWRWGYPFCLGLMAGIAGLLLHYFHRKGWLQKQDISVTMPRDS